ncbi:HET-like protein [Alternaria alternata]|nr:HET-like protein [Alternaria alternata]
MSDSTEYDTLCERCSLLSFDDLALGGQEVVNEDGVARLCFPKSRIELRPSYDFDAAVDMPVYRSVRLDWEAEDVLPDMPRLSHSSQLGCVFCQALLKSLKEAFAEEAKSYEIHDGTLNLVAYLSLDDEGVEGLLVEATFNQDRFDKTSNTIHTLFPIEADSDCGKWLGAQTTREQSYLDPINIGTMRRFVDHCTSKCHPWIPSPFMPTRLIDVGHDAFDVPRLAFSSDIPKTEQPKYAALSYCWGNEEDAKSQFKTEKASLEDRCVGLPIELMTPTTKDAIATTRAIGLRYLWIDALCIIQDDKDDWSHESSQMNLVYRHAFVTFCTLNTNSCHESFLNRAPALEITFQSTLRKAIKGSYLVRLRQNTDVGLDDTNYRSVTFDKDRLPAIAGLARVMGEVLRDQYLAGLWKGDLLEGLVWESAGAMMSRGLNSHLQNIRRRNYVAPSWSWATSKAMASLDVSVDADSDDPYGRISGGFLRISGKLAAIPKWLPTTNGSEWSNSWFYSMGRSNDTISAYTDWLHKDQEAGLDLLVAMLLFRVEPDDGIGAPVLQGLLLHPTDAPKQYYRVGTIRSQGPKSYEVMIDWFKDSQEDTICII